MSDINPNNIDREFPVAGQDQSSEGFRQNFTSTADNFLIAKREITDLQNKVLLKAALTGSLLNNDMSGAIIQSATMRDMRLSVYPITETPGGKITLDPTNGTYQYINQLSEGDYSLDVIVSPINNTITQVFLEISAAANTEIQFQSNASGIIYQGFDAISGVVNKTNGPTLVFQRPAARSNGTARVFSLVIRSTSSSVGTSGIVTITDISDLESRGRVEEPYQINDRYIGSEGDRLGDIRVTPPVGTTAAKVWWCYRDYDGNNIIWSQAIGTDKDLSPRGPANSVQINDIVNGVFQGYSTFVFNPPTLDSSNVVTASGNLTLGNTANGAVNTTIWGNITFISGMTPASKITLGGEDFITAKLQGNVTGNVTGSLTGNSTGTHTGNVVGNISGTTGTFSGNVTAQGITATGTASIQGNVTTASFYQGNGRFLTGVFDGPDAYSNANVANYLPTYGGNIAAGTITLNANSNINSQGGNILLSGSVLDGNGGIVSASYFIGDGSNLRNLNIENVVGAYGNSNVQAYLSSGNVTGLRLTSVGAIQSNSYINLSGGNVLYSDSNVAAYLPRYTGAIGGLDFDGNVLTDVGGITLLGNAVLDLTAASNPGPNITNIRISGGGTGQVLSTRGDGTLYWGNSSGGSSANAAGDPGDVQFRSFSNVSLGASTAFNFNASSNVLRVGGSDSPGNGNIVTGTITANSVIIASNGTFSASTADITASYFIGNGSQLTGINSGDLGEIQFSNGSSGFTSNSEFSIDTAGNSMTVSNFSATGNAEITGDLSTDANLLVGDSLEISGSVITASNANLTLNTTLANALYANLTANIRGPVQANVFKGEIETNAIYFNGLFPFGPNAESGRPESNTSTTPGGNIYIWDYSSNGASAANAVLTIRTQGVDTDGITVNGTTTVIRTGGLEQQGNITADFYLGNIRFTTGGYGNSNVADYLPTYTGNLVSLTGDVITTANVNAGYFNGNIRSANGGYDNANVFNYLGSNSNAVFTTTGDITTTGTIAGEIITITAAPATASSPGTPGQIAYASGFIYVCVAANTWQRANLSTWT